MMKKNGIAITTLVVTIIVLLILAGTIAASTYSTMNFSRLSTWINEISYIQDVVEEYESTTSALPYTTNTLQINVSNLSSEQIMAQFEGETISNNIVTLNELDLGNLKITNTSYGNLETSTDVYAYSTTTGRVYYVQGIEIDEIVYYTYTEALKDRFNLSQTNNQLNSVVFVPSVIGYTNQPITVTVKIPNSFTNISITTSNAQVVVGTQTLVDDIYQYTVNTSNVTGNYNITVTYTSGSQSYTATYAVNTYDATSPVIAEITDENIVTINDTMYLNNITATDASGIKHLKYTTGTISEENAKTYFSTNGNNVVSGKINISGEATEYTIYSEDRAGNYAILLFTKEEESNVPEAWKAYVSQVTEEGVPIPKGFVVSPYTDEDEIAEGLVIYALTTTEITNKVTDITTIDANQQASLESRNQFVWVPVDKTTFATSNTQFKRTDYKNSTSKIVTDSVGTNSKYWELVLTSTNMPSETQSTSFVSPSTLLEATAMYESVAEYGGFYIARYEAGGSQMSGNFGRGTLSITMGKYPYNTVKWGTSMSNEVLKNDTTTGTDGAVTLARAMYTSSNTNYGVVSTLTYGVQWDRALDWIKSIKGDSFSLTSGSENGNYSDTTLSAEAFNTNAKYATATYNSSTTGKYVIGEWTAGTSFTARPTTSNTYLIMTTGALKKANLCNIYDMAGNLFEWTMEGYSASNRIRRGGSFGGSGSRSPVSSRADSDPTSISSNCGFRPALYIKK